MSDGSKFMTRRELRRNRSSRCVNVSRLWGPRTPRTVAHMQNIDLGGDHRIKNLVLIPPDNLYADVRKRCLLRGQRVLCDGVDCRIDRVDDVARSARTALINVLKNFIEIGERPVTVVHLHATP